MSYIQYDTSTEGVLEPYDKFQEYRLLEKIPLIKSKRDQEATEEGLNSLSEELKEVAQIINTNNRLLGDLNDNDNATHNSLRFRARPFDSLKKMYLNMAGLKLANIFSLLDLNDVYKVLDIGGGPGGFATFIKSRFPDVEYHGITLETYPFDSSLTLTKIYTESVFEENNYSSLNLNADLVLSDLANVDEEFQISDIRYVKVSNDIAFSNLARGGTYICKLFEIHSLPILRIIFNMGRSFNKWKLFKPITSPYENGEIYFIGVGYKGKLYDMNLRMREVEKLVKDFANYIAVRRKAYALRLTYDITPVKYNIHLAKAMWSEKS